jgi:hypothetical protein
LFPNEDYRFSSVDTTIEENAGYDSVMDGEYGAMVPSDLATMGMYNRQEALIQMARKMDPII